MKSIVNKVIFAFVLLISLITAVSTTAFLSSQRLNDTIDSIEQDAIGIARAATELRQIISNASTATLLYQAPSTSIVDTEALEAIDASQALARTSIEQAAALAENSTIQGLFQFLNATERESALAVIDSFPSILNALIDSKEQAAASEMAAHSSALIYEQDAKAMLTTLSKLNEMEGVRERDISFINFHAAASHELVNRILLQRSDDQVWVVKSNLDRSLRMIEKKIAYIKKKSESSAELINKEFAPLFSAVNSDAGVLNQHLNKIAQYDAQMVQNQKMQNASLELDTLLNLIDTRVALHTSGLIDQAKLSAANSTKIVAALLVVSLALAITTSVYLTLKIKRSIAVLNRALHGLSQRQLGGQPLREGQDEFGILARQTNAVQHELKNAISALSQSSSDLNQLSDHLLEQSQESLQQTDKQASYMTEMTAAIEQMNSAIADVGRSANQTLDAADSTLSGSQACQNAAQSSIEAIASLENQLIEVNRRVEALTEQSQNVESVVSVIHGISEQTNLLALNAAIESARAGEMGRGFSVVANEVRLLSEKTRESTGTIQATLQALNEEINLVANDIKRSVEYSNISAASSKQVGSLNQALVEEIVKIKDMSAQVSCATEEQSTACRSILTNIKAVNDASDQIVKLSEASDAQCQTLRSYAHSNQEIVNRFTL
ncbi:methyl-accepting chemotaxis protein [Vibrio sp. SM6]|uniref:Methyl-accepting chemotaxis protein n=1 Tax=Vibrio agarilyticus TaxID=2726741 RepID=A0A7X8YFT7_9VIBR|nr:methyl-accepting chemotaxis protein [Vibrio agarilyticus]NLS11681.1 methyl-accepting chemotaxis protein [Vibrio agarilyticus]